MLTVIPPLGEINADYPVKCPEGGQGQCSRSQERGREESSREAQGGVSLSSENAHQASDPSAREVVGQLNRVLNERGYPSVSAGDDIELAVSQMVQDAQDGWTCFADAEASRLLQQKNSHHA